MLDDLSTGRRANLAAVEGRSDFVFVEGSVLDEGLVTRLIAEADVVYHLAAAVGVAGVLRHPLRSLETNILGDRARVAGVRFARGWAAPADRFDV